MFHAQKALDILGALEEGLHGLLDEDCLAIGAIDGGDDLRSLACQVKSFDAKRSPFPEQE